MSTPKVLKLGFLLDPRLRVKQPIRLQVNQERGGSWYLAYSTLLNEGGYGKNSADAIKDFQKRIAANYWFYDRVGMAKLGPGLQKEFRAYRRKIGVKAK